MVVGHVILQGVMISLRINIKNSNTGVEPKTPFSKTYGLVLQRWRLLILSVVAACCCILAWFRTLIHHLRWIYIVSKLQPETVT